MKGHRSSGGLSPWLRAIDIYRKVPVDLTKGSTVGGTLSVAAAVILFMLFVLELRSFFAVGTATSIKIDHRSVRQLCAQRGARRLVLSSRR